MSKTKMAVTRNRPANVGLGCLFALLSILSALECVILLFWVPLLDLPSSVDQLLVEDRQWRWSELFHGYAEKADRILFDYHSLRNTSSSTEKPLVVHVAKEFGHASMGGLGAIVTTMAELLHSKSWPLLVVIPYYSYLRDKENENPPVRLNWEIQFKVKSKWIGGLDIPVFRGYSPFSSEEHAVRPIVYHGKFNGINTIMIGPPEDNLVPFNWVFHAKDLLSIYGGTNIDQEWQDLYFATAVAHVVRYLARLNVQSESVPYFSLSEGKQTVVHLHGSTVGMVAPFFRSRFINTSESSRVSFVYTLHDYSYEARYYISQKNIRIFDERFGENHKKSLRVNNQILFKRLSVLRPSINYCKIFCVGERFYTSGIAITFSDAVTFVSKIVAQQIISTPAPFIYSELVVDFIFEKARRRRFFGISNGVSFDKLNPFYNEQLVEAGLNFEKEIWEDLDAIGSVTSKKLGARRLLHDRFGIITKEQSERPMIVYIGRFEKQKGVADCLELARILESRQSTLILMGHRNDYPIEQYLKNSFSDNTVIILEGDEIQRQIGIFVRMAADFAFVPSKTESFGLVAAEAMFFGTIVISTGVGGLTEILIDRLGENGHELGNSYLYRMGNLTSMEKAVDLALKDHRMMKINDTLDEFLIRNLIQYTRKLGWDKSIRDYISLYKIMATSKD